MKKVNIITGLLLVYLVVMAVLGWPGKGVAKGIEPDFMRYFLTLAAALVVIFLLRWLQIRRLKFRESQKKDEK